MGEDTQDLANELKQLIQDAPKISEVDEISAAIPVPKPSDGTFRLSLGLLLLVGALIAAFVTFEPYHFIEGAGEKALSVLGTLIIIALFVERAQQVYINAWRGLARARLDRALEQWQELLGKAETLAAQGQLKGTEVQGCFRNVNQIKDAINIYSTETRKIAFIGGIALGIAISLAGPRILIEILEPFGDPGSFQAALFSIIDVFITGGLIGGGSEGLHHLMEVFTGYLKQTKKKINTPAPAVSP